MIEYLFASLVEAGLFLKNKVEQNLNEQVRITGGAVFILPGGNSIKHFFPYLVSLNVPWDCIIVGLSDERLVHSDDEMSNEKNLRKNLLNFIPNHHYCSLNDEMVTKIQEFPPVTILSMGVDGHVASLFPEEADEWKQCISGIYKTKFQEIRRISLSEQSLLKSSSIYLLVIGEEKNEFFDLKKDFLSFLYHIYHSVIVVRCISEN